MPNIKLPEPPTREPEISSRLWVRWFQELKRLLVTQITQAVDWAEINLTSADIADIPVRKHTDLQDLNTATYTHLSSTNATDLTDGGDTTLHFHSADRNSDNFTGTKWVDLTDAGATTLHKHSHNAQDDLQGGSAASYYHLTQTQHTDLTDGGATTLHYHTAAPNMNVGDVAGGDYLEIEADGTLQMHGAATVWRDELGDITRIKTVGTRITADNAEGSMVFATNCVATTDYLITNVQMNHDRLNGAVVQPHLHWWQTEDHSPHWLVKYRWQINGGAKTTAWTDYKLDQLAFTYVSGTLNQISEGAGITPPTGDGISDILQIQITRDTTSTVYVGADPYTAAVHATSFDVHLELDTLGSREEYVK